ncbi:MAG TPA: hypothetical protein VEV21_04455 [Burkholderiales bacterium]|nr:hypothetical protein [Burkholderiales bacterium]
MATKEEGAAKEAAKQSVNLQLMPANGSDQPVLANVTLVEPTAGVALLDFGFLDPGALAALSRMARAGKQVPERLNGRLAALHQQIGGVLQAVSRRQEADAR